jgi:hypothetical protein
MKNSTYRSDQFIENSHAFIAGGEETLLDPYAPTREKAVQGPPSEQDNKTGECTKTK